MAATSYYYVLLWADTDRDWMLHYSLQHNGKETSGEALTALHERQLVATPHTAHIVSTYTT